MLLQCLESSKRLDLSHDNAVDGIVGKEQEDEQTISDLEELTIDEMDIEQVFDDLFDHIQFPRKRITVFVLISMIFLCHLSLD